ncbi:MAG TPA: hypothetical protein VI589_03255 [Vicinamibacteria bacterium]
MLLPCPLPLALAIQVTDLAGAPVPGAVAEVSGAARASIPCNSGNGMTCYLLGYAGIYRLELRAPGFETAVRTVTVGGTSPQECGCATTFAEHIAVTLVPTP